MSSAAPSRRDFLAGAAAALSAGLAGCARTELSAPPAEVDETGINVMTMGARGDGRSDDTAALQRAIDTQPAGSSVIVPSGTYLINLATGLDLRSGTTLQLADDAVLAPIAALASAEMTLLRCEAVRGVTVEGGRLQLEGRAPWFRTCRRAFGLVLRGASDIRISRLTIDDAYTDAIYVGRSSSAPTYNITIEDCRLRGARRQGISVTHAERVRIRGCAIGGTTGAPPSSAIDLEPNPGTQVRDVEISRCHLASNEGAGVLAVGLYGPVSDVRIEECVTAGNMVAGVRLLKSDRVSIVANELHETDSPAISVDVGSRDVLIDSNSRPGNGAVIIDAPTPVVPPQRPGGGGCQG